MAITLFIYNPNKLCRIIAKVQVKQQKEIR